MEITEIESKGMALLKKGQKGLKKVLFSRLGLILLFLLTQALFLASIFFKFSEFLPHFYGVNVLLGVGLIVHLLNSKYDPTAKITWLIVIMILPVFGALLYWFTENDWGHKAIKARVHEILVKSDTKIPQSSHVMDRLKQKDEGISALAKYVRRSGCYPVFDQTDVTYFPTGEEKFKVMLEELEKAQKFIFLEYFIIDEGLMWGKILEILARKASEGVDVRVLYDGMNEFSTLTRDYAKRLRKLGIKCHVFSAVTPFVSTHYNYRDHRKILVIDGQTAFNGGVNLADEYINVFEKYGHWKDVAVMLKGKAVKSFTLMFLQMWNIEERIPQYDPFLDEEVYHHAPVQGFVMPYGDCPLDNDRVGERVYMDILNRAHHYVHIMSPYLILDSEMESAIKFAAERGVEVSIILPGIPDKYVPYALAYTHYASLLESGVKIYEYTPGFVHAKVFVADDKEGVVGTINLDYRSLYHHFECATYMYQVSCLDQIEKDFHDTKKKCREVTSDNLSKISAKRKIVGALAKFVAPLM